MNRKIAVIGLGYVGLPLAVAFGTKSLVIAFDIQEKRIEMLKNGIDSTLEVGSDDLQQAQLQLTSDPNDLKAADFYIVAVPTPINEAKQPNLIPLIKASETIGPTLKMGDIVVYESTVYPGVTEEICASVLEKFSGLVCGEDFFIAYSPERINPGDKEHTFTKIKKVVSAQTAETLQVVSQEYASVVEAGIYEASSIKVAEAAKVIENAQRDINIAFVNELQIIFDKMEIDVHEVLEAAGTKWNFLSFEPGLVGGHCIGVDPYYLTYKAQQLGYNPEVILAGRRINDGMGKYIAEKTIKSMVKHSIHLNGAKVGILGFAFKENCPDARNTKVIDIVNELKHYYVVSVVHDPVVDCKLVKQCYDIDLVSIKELRDCEVLVLAVPHQQFKAREVMELIHTAAVVIDVKNFLGKKKTNLHTDSNLISFTS